MYQRVRIVCIRGQDSLYQGSGLFVSEGQDSLYQRVRIVCIRESG